jgi:T5orf172 domain
MKDPKTGIQLSLLEALGMDSPVGCEKLCCRKRAGIILAAAKAMDDYLVERGDSKAPSYRYTRSDIKADLICGGCGSGFSIRPSAYKAGNGCLKCANICPEKSRSEFEAKLVDRGDSLAGTARYVNVRTKIEIICGKCSNAFLMTPYSYKCGRGCHRCSGRCPRTASANLDAQIEQRGDRKAESYVYVDSKKKIDLVCGKCENDFSLLPGQYRRGSQCPRCAGKCPVKAREDFEKMILDRGDSMALSYKYINTSIKVALVCGKCLREFTMQPHSYKSGQGCPKCRASGFNPAKPGTLYYLAFYPDVYRIVYKIGVTNRSVKKRYEECKTPYDLIWQKQYESGADCWEMESKIITRYRQYKCEDAPVQGLSNRELFQEDIASLSGFWDSLRR